MEEEVQQSAEETEIVPTIPVTSDAPEEPDSPTALPLPVVAIGGSAGGVEAYIELFRHLNANTGMAFVLISHLPPDQKSHLPEIVGRHTQMEALLIQNGTRPEPNHVYLLPPNASVSFRDGAFQLERRGNQGAFHPIDSFFQSLAAAQKNFSVGIVLSGMDADGSLGLKAIKGEGGITIVQSPESARYPEMPRSSISADHVDLVLPPEQMGRHLARLAESFQNPELRVLEEGGPAPDEGQYLGRILKLLKGVSGDFRLYKPTTIRRRIARRMLMHRVDSLADYATMLPSNTKELRELQEDILISVTRFFRDPETFDALKSVVFQQLFDGRSPEQQVRIWVPGCSSGEEVYSIAICLLEFLTGNAIEPPIQIFGTDASERSIQKARVGIYPETILSEVSQERLRRFFIKTEKGYQVAKRIRDLCIFARQNLCTDPPFSRLDLISCRNVLIYFGSQLQRQLIPTFHYALRPDGYLLLGSSETIREFTDLFQLTDRKHKIYAKLGATPQRALMEVAPRAFAPNLPEEPVGAPAGGGDLGRSRHSAGRGPRHPGALRPSRSGDQRKTRDFAIARPYRAVFGARARRRLTSFGAHGARRHRSHRDLRGEAGDRTGSAGAGRKGADPGRRADARGNARSPSHA